MEEPGPHRRHWRRGPEGGVGGGPRGGSGGGPEGGPQGGLVGRTWGRTRVRTRGGRTWGEDRGEDQREGWGEDRRVLPPQRREYGAPKTWPDCAEDTWHRELSETPGHQTSEEWVPSPQPQGRALTVTPPSNMLPSPSMWFWTRTTSRLDSGPAHCTPALVVQQWTVLPTSHRPSCLNPPKKETSLNPTDG